jgi:iron(III) transport system substrate-binding protein
VKNRAKKPVLKLLPLLAVCLFLLSGCGTGADAPAQRPPEEAKRLVVYTSHKQEVYEPIIREFERRTGIFVTVQTGGTNEMLERIAAEAGAPAADVMFGGGVESLEAYNQYFAACDACAPFALDNRLPNSRWTEFSSLPLVLIYNTRLLSAGDAPRGWADLLSGRFKGQIALASPAVSGSSYTALCTMAQALGLEAEETVGKLADNLSGRVLSDSGETVGAVAGGHFLVGVTLEETARKGIAAGRDIAIVYPCEGTSAVPDGAAVVKDCAHADNAQCFLAFILGNDVQERLNTRFFRRSVISGLFETGTDDTFTVINYDVARASARKADVLKAWAREVGE